MGLHCLTFMGRNLVPMQIIKNPGLNSKNIVNDVHIFKDNATMNSDFRE